VNGTRLPDRVLRRFIESVAVNLGADQFNAVLALSRLPMDWSKPETFLKMDRREAARAYAALQSSVRVYFGRGARGVLLRVGEHLWHQLLADASIVDKAQSAVIKRLPLPARRKQTLELLGRFLETQPDEITVHTLDLDLLLADHASPSTDGQSASAPICFVTQGLIRESLFWVARQRYDVEETSCKAMGERTCEFKVTVGKEG
jgi:predicted hydrocarbon binding protein